MKKIYGSFFKVVIRIKNNDSLLNDYTLIKDYKIIKPKLGYWAADPFVAYINGTNYLFVEMCSYFTGNGHISYIKLDTNNNKWNTLIKDGTHFSFPLIFQKDGETFIIPENSQKQEVSMYKFLPYKNNIIKVRNIISNVKAVDSLLFEYKKILYFFTYLLGNKNTLNIYYFDSQNSLVFIKSIDDDNNFLRPAGQIFIHNNELIFPSQNNKIGYGDDIIFNKITLSKSNVTFVGKLDLSIKQLLDKKINGCHTFNQNTDYEVIDIRFNKISILRLIGWFYRVLFKPRKNKR